MHVPGSYFLGTILKNAKSGALQLIIQAKILSRR